jgi:hypothetical protein
MAQIPKTYSDHIHIIDKWLGVNESGDGDTNLRMGEASAMTNFRITNDGGLQKRPGTKKIHNIAPGSAYDLVTDTAKTTVKTETSAVTQATFTCYPNAAVTENGDITLSGAAVTVNKDNIASHTGKYWRDDATGAVYALGELETLPPTGTEVTGGYIKFDSTTKPVRSVVAYSSNSFPAYGSVGISGGVLSVAPSTVVLVGTTNPFAAQEKFVVGESIYTSDPTIYKIVWILPQETQGHVIGYTYLGRAVEIDDGYVYNWNFYRVNCTPNLSDSTVRALWSGRVGGIERIMAACSGYLWAVAKNPITSLFANSRFSDGTTGFETKDTTALTVTNGVASYTPTAQYAYIAKKNISITSGKRYYYRAIIRTTDTPLAFMLAKDVAPYTNISIAWYGGTGMFDMISALGAATETAADYTLSIGDQQASGWSETQINEMLAADVTALVEGKSDADAKAWCDKYIQYDINGNLTVTDPAASVWTKTQIGVMDTTQNVTMFSFDEKLYVMNGYKYYVWDGTTFSEVNGYVPLVAVAVPPAGGGTALQRVNMLTGKRRIRISPDGTATTFQLPEKDLAVIGPIKNAATGATYTLTTDYTVNLISGTVTFVTAPAAGTSTREIEYEVKPAVSGPLRLQLEKMTRSEFYNGVSDNRIFIYGDGTNKAFYSDLDYNGKARADYFPDLNVIHFGESGAPLTSMVRHYDRLLAFKTDSAYSVRYDAITLVSGTVTAGFYVLAINKGIGSEGYGQAVLVENHPRTLDSNAIYEWIATSASGTISSDQRNAQRISKKVTKTLQEMDIKRALAFYDKANHEYYVVQNGIAVVQNTETGAWYIYRDFPAVSMIVHNNELYYGTGNGDLRHVSREYMHDDGAAITCYWESGSMDFGAAFTRKYSDTIWIVLKPEDNANVNVTIQTDQQNDYNDETVIAGHTGEVSQAFFDFLDLSFEHFTFNVNDKPQTQRRKIKVRNFTWYKLIFSTVSNNTTATVLNASVKVRQTGYVR